MILISFLGSSWLVEPWVYFHNLGPSNFSLTRPPNLVYILSLNDAILMRLLLTRGLLERSGRISGFRLTLNWLVLTILIWPSLLIGRLSCRVPVCLWLNHLWGSASMGKIGWTASWRRREWVFPSDSEGWSLNFTWRKTTSTISYHDPFFRFVKLPLERVLRGKFKDNL